jgi:hypothetical protein
VQLIARGAGECPSMQVVRLREEHINKGGIFSGDAENQRDFVKALVTGDDPVGEVFKVDFDGIKLSILVFGSCIKVREVNHYRFFSHGGAPLCRDWSINVKTEYHIMTVLSIHIWGVCEIVIRLSAA